ncbi:Crp/Fnr family transcriptional regulator [Pararhodospirillum photometricum]|uniref:Transcriptional regulator, Crp n=1 Tax=Pararhodospirillum photometricum DSM 122 TaxID=1150469 RepID=H6SMZ4_PARPM|nr:cyclic nucleotide-binding domain-containing protein [Pararhodospirillum photometricum]CCG06870.1 Transcriptional regulator, Crp [Pararhodospirillum photometricum DSM 122]
MVTDSLDGIALLEELDPSQRQELARLCRWRRYAAGEQIIDRQSETRDVFFVVRGQARVVIYSASGREVSLDDITEGGFFGELAALDGAPRSASVMAVSECLVATMSPELFLKIIREQGSVAMQLLWRLAAMVRASTERIVDLSTLGANNRVQAEILRRALEARTDPEGRPVIQPIPVHGEVASRVSTTRETVARVLSDLARRGIVRRERDALLVLDLGRLEVMVSDMAG